MGKITIKDIAQKANVSPGTVSKILTGKYKEDQIQISQATIDKVIKIADGFNYQPNYAARLLSTGKAYTIGIYMPRSRKRPFYFDHYYTDIINSVSRCADENGYDILLISHGSYIDKFITNRIDALIIIEQLEMDEELIFLIEKNKPFVIINNLIDEKLDAHSINIDNYSGVKSIVQFFLKMNHTRLGFIGELIATPQKEHQIRLNYFRSILKEEAVPLNENLFLLGKTEGITEKITDQFFDQLSGYYGMQYLVENHREQFSAVFCANDVIAIGALSYLYKANIRVPEQISVIGFDDVDFAAHLMGGLTTVKQPLDIMGTEAFTLLLKILASKEAAKHEHIQIQPQLIIRETVAELTQ